MVTLADLDPRLDDVRIEPGEDLRPLPLKDDHHKTHINTSLKSDKSKLVSQTLIHNADLFAWIATDMPRVSLDIITHSG